jgi:hypothetical protein
MRKSDKQGKAQQHKELSPPQKEVKGGNAVLRGIVVVVVVSPGQHPPQVPL